MSILSAITAACASLLLLRRCLEFRAIATCLHKAEERRREAEGSEPPVEELPHIVVLLPLYREQLVAAQLFHHFRRMRYPASHLRVVFITTAKEEGDSGTSTKEIVEGLFAKHREPHFLHLHFPRTHRFRAEQLNFAVEQAASGLPRAHSYIGVYNADSLPDEDTLLVLARDACRRHRETGEFPPAYQQGARYFVPARHHRIGSAHAVAAFQTLYTFAHYLPRLFAAEMRKGVPATFLGHGEFIRVDVLYALGLFPKYAYADGLLMGWEVAFGGYPIRVLPSRDHCEVPGGLPTTYRQHTAWFLGLLNLDAALRAHFGNSRRSAAIRLFCARRMLSTLSWGLRSLFLAVLLAISLAAGPGWFAFSIASVVLYAASPLIVLNRKGSVLSTAEKPEALSSGAASRLAMSIPTLFVDGAGFWSALAMKWKSRTPAMPPKTDR